METVYIVVLTEYGIVTTDEIRVFNDKGAALYNFHEIADDINLIESDTYVDMCDEDSNIYYIYSKHYSVIMTEKTIE